jgi:O-methyltransferase involved in polyketide biosynthesis
MTNTIDDAYELDRPEVMSIKQPLMERLLLRQNQRKANITKPLDKYHLPKLIGMDLNNVTQVQWILMDILGTGYEINSRETAEECREQPRIVWHTIFLFEGVMIYLNKDVPNELLRICSTVCPSHSTLVFADRLEHIIDSEGDGGSNSRECAANVLKNVGWKLEDWCTKPGFARHMGIATTPS